MDDSLFFRVEAYGQLEAFVRKDFNGYWRRKNGKFDVVSFRII